MHNSPLLSLWLFPYRCFLDLAPFLYSRCLPFLQATERWRKTTPVSILRFLRHNEKTYRQEGRGKNKYFGLSFSLSFGVWFFSRPWMARGCFCSKSEMLSYACTYEIIYSSFAPSLSIKLWMYPEMPLSKGFPLIQHILMWYLTWCSFLF